MTGNLIIYSFDIVENHVIYVKSIQDVGTSNNGDGEFYDAINKFDRSISSLSDDSSVTPEFKSPANGSPKDIKRAEVEQGIPVLEVRSAEEIDLAFKQLQEGADVEEVILPSMIKDQLGREKSGGNSEANSHLKVIEAGSLDDINVAFELTSEVNKEKLSKSSDLKDGIGKGEANEAGEFIGGESSNHEISKISTEISEKVPRSTSNNEATTQSKRSSSSSCSSSGDSD
ncbi:uncharacterized protein LOC114719960 [Neltuma alba]|uniref:uncharacterized protein LOC114719960 n=1 Tax=Neltuma alba TaxID=207710 RepID=UPI0010A47E0B|nr:uncharacterized protein LOC114719960 [Prosopis alba]